MAKRSLRLLVTASIALGLGLGAGRAQAANWYDGPPSRVQHVCNNFITTLNEDLVWTWVGFQDVNEGGGSRLPKTGETYYVRVVLGGLGCSGAWVHPEIKLPKSTSLAITSQTPMRCFVDRPNQPPRQPLPCPAAPVTGLYPNGTGFYAIYPPNNQPYWALPNGNIIYFEIPVTSSAPLSGIATNDYAVAAVNILDNNPGGGNPPWDNPNPPSSGPWQGVFVTQAGAPRSPYVSYADNSAIPGKTSATTDFTINNVDCVVSGNLQGDLFRTDNQPDTAAFGGSQCIAGCCTPPCATGASVTYRYTWTGLEADTSYKWRGFIQSPSLQIANGCSRTLTDAQTNATSPQWAYFKTLANAAKPPSYSLLLHTTGTGGTLGATPALPSGQTRYQPGTKVTVTAQPGAGFHVKTLSLDGVAATSPAAVVMNDDHAVEATFEADGASDPDAGPADPDAGGGGGGGGNGGNGGGGGCNAAGSGSGGGAAWLALGVAALVAARRRAKN